VSGKAHDDFFLEGAVTIARLLGKYFELAVGLFDGTKVHEATPAPDSLSRFTPEEPWH
jgi:hypothetical protein